MTGFVDLVAALAGLSAFFAVCGLWLQRPDPVGHRLKRLAERGQRSAAGAPVGAAARTRQGLDLMRLVTERLDLLRTSQAREMRRLLAQAGWRGRDALVILLFAKLSLPVVLGAAAFTLLYVFHVWNFTPLTRYAIAAGALLGGVYGPDLFVRNSASHRRNKLLSGLPDALDLMVICAEAGLSLDAGLSRVSRELQRAAPELGDELAVATAELGFLPDRRQALDNLQARSGLAEMRGVINTLIQSEQFGTPLAQSLRVLAAEYRGDRMMRAEEKAARLPAIMSVPLILFILPTLFLVLLGPAILNTIDTLHRM